jgi:hypothetical protein
MLHNIDSIQDMIGTPKLSGIADKSYQLLLSQAFMKEAEVSRPWAGIGFDEWIRAGRWWLLKAQSTLYGSDTKALPPQAFADLLKASFILVDIFPGHPQRRFWTSEYIQVEILAEDLKRELDSIDRLGYQKPDLNLVQASDLTIWSDAPPALVVQPKPRDENSPAAASWQTSTEEVLWMGFGSCGPKDGQSKNEDCVILILVSHDTAHTRIVTQNQKGKDLLTLDIDFLWTWHLFEKLESKFFSRSRGIVPLAGQSSLTISDFQLAFSTERNLDDFTVFLTAIILHESFHGFTKTATSMKAFILFFAMGRRRYDLLASYLDVCQQIPDTQPQSPRIESELYQLAINTSQLVLDKKRSAQSSDLELFPPIAILADNEPFNKIYDSKIRLETSGHIWNWLLLAIEWPIRLGTNWKPFLRNVYLWPANARRITAKGLGIDALAWLAVANHSPTIASLLEHCSGYLTYHSGIDEQWMYEILWALPRPEGPSLTKKLYNYLLDMMGPCRNLLFLALHAENFPAITYFLDRKELLLKFSLLLFELADLKITGDRAAESMRNPKTIILLLTIFAKSSKMKQHLLHHSSLNDTYSAGLLNVHLSEIFTLMFPGPETEPEVPPPSRLLARLVQLRTLESVYGFLSPGKLWCTQMHKMLIDDVFRYGPVSDQTRLDTYLVVFLESGNILAARKLVEHGAQLTLQAENVRGDLVLEMYQLLSRRKLLNSVFGESRLNLDLQESISELLWDINWVFGGRFDLSYLDGCKAFKKKVDDMGFWNTGQKSIEVNEMLDKIDNEQGRPINLEFRV